MKCTSLINRFVRQLSRDARQQRSPDILMLKPNRMRCLYCDAIMPNAPVFNDVLHLAAIATFVGYAKRVLRRRPIHCRGTPKPTIAPRTFHRRFLLAHLYHARSHESTDMRPNGPAVRRGTVTKSLFRAASDTNTRLLPAKTADHGAEPP